MKPLDKYLELLTQWNSKINLVSTESLKNAEVVHFQDSIKISEIIHNIIGKEELSDLGSGAGFPGLVYAHLYPESQITLYERIDKKRAFLLAVTTELKLKNITLKGEYQWKALPKNTVARAVMPLEDLLEKFQKAASLDSRLFIPVSSLQPDSSSLRAAASIEGSRGDSRQAPRSNLVEEQIAYDLPLLGKRFVLVSRGTK